MIGTVDSLWRYPVKSMRGEELAEVFIGFGGIEGDRRFAFHSSAAPLDFPFFTARQQTQMLRYRPRVDPDNGSIEVETPSGKTLAIDDPALIDELRSGADPKHKVTLVRFNRSQADGHAVFDERHGRVCGRSFGYLRVHGPYCWCFRRRGGGAAR